MPKSKKKLTKTGKKLMQTSRTQLFREYMEGYWDGEKYFQTVTYSTDLAPYLDDSWSEGYRDGFVDGYNDNLENMRIE